MKEIVIISGKGGTGKTSITAAFAMLAGNNAVIADCDVDAADMHLLLEPDFSHAEDFYSGFKAVIDQQKCTKCGKCKQVCRFDAVQKNDDSYTVTPMDCEGCAYCAEVCPAAAIQMVEQNVGKWYISKIKSQTEMVHAKLGIGADNSGKLVAKVKKEAKNVALQTGKDLILVDGSPGIGCPVVSSLSGADYVILVTEPTLSGFHDMKRVFELIQNFHLSSGCIINKYDVNVEIAEKIHDFCETNSVDHIANIPYDETFTAAMTEGKTIIEFDDGNLTNILKDSWKKILLLTDSH
ncbi:MAG TPA: 4Fe-4S dicluster domain-containing protein [Candidatus Cloacimonetes bacterium]|nr:4Fe-4S dicluster domain-containing protein [Candidatus Cloacimonadota bacterium]HEX38120.1 4Fe-4S dicluster domain-containing protein [Candidatus Cloacimonadota bacterium]